MLANNLSDLARRRRVQVDFGREAQREVTVLATDHDDAAQRVADYLSVPLSRVVASWTDPDDDPWVGR